MSLEHMMHRLRMGSQVDLIHLNLEGKDEWLFFCAGKCLTSLMWRSALIGIKSEVGASDEMQANCKEGECYFG